MALLGDNRAHVFAAGADLDLVDPTGRECMLSQGDVVHVVGIPPGAPVSANAVVLASKGGTGVCNGEECRGAARRLARDAKRGVLRPSIKAWRSLQAKRGPRRLRRPHPLRPPVRPA